MTDAEIVAWHRRQVEHHEQESAHWTGAASKDVGEGLKEHWVKQAKSCLRLAEHHTRAADAIEENARLRAALVALTTNPHLNLGDLVYTVREREGLGWEGPAVKAWSDAVQAADAALRKPDAAE